MLHGLYMQTWAMRPLAYQLSKHGLLVACFGYHSVIHALPTHSQRLYRWLSKNYDLKNTSPLHFVGHSLGGLVIRDFIYRYPDVTVGRVVTIGTPHNGSASAHRLRPHVPTFLGNSYIKGLDGNTPALREGIELGVIAGNKPAGLGRLILPKTSEPNDGTVMVSETRLNNACDHLVVPHSHIGMPFSKSVAAQTGYFLANGKFRQD